MILTNKTNMEHANNGILHFFFLVRTNVIQNTICMTKSIILTQRGAKLYTTMFSTMFSPNPNRVQRKNLKKNIQTYKYLLS